MSKHTPAPWRIASSNFDNGFYVIHANDHTSSTPRELQVVKLDYGSHPDKCYLEKAEANAKLITAAPELLEALERALHDFRNMTWTDETYNIIEATIKKATL